MVVGCIISEFGHPQYPAAITRNFLISNITCLRSLLTEMGSSTGDVHNLCGNRDRQFKFGRILEYLLDVPSQIRANSISWIGAYPLFV